MAHLIDPPNYHENYTSMPTDWETADTSFDLGWISNLFDIANKTLRKIYADFENFVLDPNDPLNFEINTDTFFDENAGPIIYLGIWTAILVLFAILGFCWCLVNKCCCCCRSSFKGRSGRNIDELENTDPHYQLRPYYSERNAKNSGGSLTVTSIVLSLLMGVWLIGFLIMILHTFASNEKTKDAVDQIKPHLDNAIKDVDTYIGITRQQLSYSFADCFEALNSKLDEVVESCTEGGCDETIRERLKQGLTTPLRQSGELVTNSSNALDGALADVQKGMQDAKDELDDDIEDIIKDVNTGLYWFFMLFNLLYCAIFGLVLIGTLLAAFGRSNGMKTGGFLLMRAAIVIQFIVGIFVILQLATMFVLAGVSSEIICPAVREWENEPGPRPLPTDEPVTSALLRHMNAPRQDEGEGGGSGDNYEVPSIDVILRSCKKDESAYTAFKLEQAFNVDELTKIVDYFNGLQPPPRGSSGKAGTHASLTPDETVQEITRQVQTYVEFIQTSIRNDLGRCKPAYLSINATISLFCDRISAPVASYWWILQFVPLTFILIIVTALFFERLLS